MTIVVPFPAGGSMDALGRIAVEKLAASWGLPVLVDNRAGAGGLVGAQRVKGAAPDGYALLLTNSALTNPNTVIEKDERGEPMGTLVEKSYPAQYVWKHGTPFLAFGEQEMDHLSPAKQLFELGVPVAAGTDAVPYNPLFCMWSMVTRRERTTGRVMGEGGKTAPEAALRILTHGGAYLTFEENEKGRLVAGQHADIAVLSANPLEVDADALREIECRATMVGGRWVHGAA